MTDIDVIIRMPEDEYKIIKNFKGPMVWVEHLIKKGTPLPKGHGRLIDENELLEITKSYKSELGRLKVDPFVKSGIETVERFIKEMSPIIEADKESEVKE